MVHLRCKPACNEFKDSVGWIFPTFGRISSEKWHSQWQSVAGSQQVRMSSGTAPSDRALLFCFHRKTFSAHFVLSSIFGAVYPFVIASLSASGTSSKCDLLLPLTSIVDTPEVERVSKGSSPSNAATGTGINVKVFLANSKALLSNSEVNPLLQTRMSPRTGN